MNRSMEFRRHALYAHFQSAVILIVSVWAHRAIVRAAPADPGAALAAAAAMALGVLAIAATLQRHVPAPRWSLFGSAGIFAAALVTAAALAPAAEGARQSDAWLFPWALMMLGLFPSRASSDRCAPPALVGRVYVGIAALLGTGYVLAARFGSPR